MARGMNKAMIIGFVERDPEVRNAADGRPVATFSVSTDRQWTTSGGECRRSTEWFHVVAWGRLAEVARRLLHRRQRVYAEGCLQTRSWEDANGQRHLLTELVANRLIPIDHCQSKADDSPDEPGSEVPLCLNRVMIIGNLGRDPEMHYTPGGQAVTSFSVAATRTSTAADGERVDSTEWFNVVSWGSLAEICNQYLTRGRRVYVEGELHTRNWGQSDGQRNVRTELVANEMIMLGPRPTLDQNDEPPLE